MGQLLFEGAATQQSRKGTVDARTVDQRNAEARAAEAQNSAARVVDRRIFNELREIVGPRGLITSREELHTYECDGLTNFRVLPRAVLLPDSTEQVQKIIRVCHREKIPFVARGSGTGSAAAPLPVENGIVISLTRMNKILEVDFANARVCSRTRRNKSRCHQSRRAARIFLCAGSVFAVGLQHWRKRGGKFGWGRIA